MYSTPLEIFMKVLIFMCGIIVGMTFLYCSKLIFNPVVVILTATLIGSIEAYLMDLVDRG